MIGDVLFVVQQQGKYSVVRAFSNEEQWSLLVPSTSLLGFSERLIFQIDDLKFILAEKRVEFVQLQQRTEGLYCKNGKYFGNIYKSQLSSQEVK